MNAEVEAGFIEIDSMPDHLSASEDESVDEAVPIDLRKEFNYFGGRFSINPFKLVTMQLEFPIIPPPISFI